jgi:hypothetical protein
MKGRHPMDPVSDDRPVRLSAEERQREHRDARLPSGGRHYEDIRLEDSPHYQGESVLHFDDSGNGSFAVNLDAADVDAVRTAVTPRVPAVPATPAQVRAYLEGLVKFWDPDPDKGLGGMASRSVEALRRVLAMLGEA